MCYEIVITPDMADEVHQSVTHENPIVSFCSACGTRYFLAHKNFVQLRGRCSCSWSCCPTARPGNQPHARHMADRPATEQDIADAEAKIIKDFREKEAK